LAFTKLVKALGYKPGDRWGLWIKKAMDEKSHDTVPLKIISKRNVLNKEHTARAGTL
jgi:hypothetical protein